MIASAPHDRSSAPLTFALNGIDATRNDYLRVPSAAELAAIARGEPWDEGQLDDAARFGARSRAGTHEPVDGRSASDLAEAGWGVIFSEHADPAVREALAELLALRREQACRREDLYRELSGTTGYRQGETKNSFLNGRGAGPGEVDPRIVPYYLLLVGGPEEIPFSFQYQLDMRYAVGRICFKTVDEYHQYARAVVEAEKRVRSRGALDLALFGTLHAQDPCTEQSARVLIDELAEKLGDDGGWRVRSYRGAKATKERLRSLLSGRDRPDVLLTATHGLWYPKDHEKQRDLQGALACQEWPGPTRKEALKPEWYFSAGDLEEDAEVAGLISFHIACYSAGTPHHDDSSPRQGGYPVQTSEPFVAALPKRLLAHPRGGALAVVAHVDQAYTHSFVWGERPWLTSYEQALRRLLSGVPLGLAMETFNRRYAELASDLRDRLEQEKLAPHAVRDDLAVAELWVATNDTRGFVILGDPAVRVPGATPEAVA